MAAAANLQQAAGQSYDKLATQWTLDQLKSHLSAFCVALLPTFPESNENARPIANWVVVMDAMAAVMASSQVPIQTLSDAALFMYKCCWLGDVLHTSGQISAAQATALLATFNAQFP